MTSQPQAPPGAVPRPLGQKVVIFLGLSLAWAGPFGATSVQGWGGPHSAITQAALQVLPRWQQDVLGEELRRLGNRYCFIPDEVHKDKQNARYATMESRPGTVYLVGLHLPGSQAENYEVLCYFLEKGAVALQRNQVGEAARYAGVLVHALEDWGCPAHSVPGDNMFTLFKQFLPPPEHLQYTLLHGPMEAGQFHVDLGDYRPRLMGATPPEAAFHLLHRAHEAILAARAQVIPIIRGIYAGDAKAVTTAQKQAATTTAATVADALYTLICLGRQHRTPEELEPLRAVDLSARWPLEATHLAWPQSAFFSQPYWGHALRGTILQNGSNAVPLKLRIMEENQAAEMVFTEGWGIGTPSTQTFLLPEGVFDRFETLVGLHSVLGMEGKVVFNVLGNGKLLAQAGPMVGSEPARRLQVPLAGITNLQLVTRAAGSNGRSHYAVWAKPCLVRLP